jgi:hypothetical protein
MGTFGQPSIPPKAIPQGAADGNTQQAALLLPNGTQPSPVLLQKELSEAAGQVAHIFVTSLTELRSHKPSASLAAPAWTTISFGALLMGAAVALRAVLSSRFTFADALVLLLLGGVIFLTAIFLYWFEYWTVQFGRRKDAGLLKEVMTEPERLVGQRGGTKQDAGTGADEQASGVSQ